MTLRQECVFAAVESLDGDDAGLELWASATWMRFGCTGGLWRSCQFSSERKVAFWETQMNLHSSTELHDTAVEELFWVELSAMLADHRTDCALAFLAILTTQLRLIVHNRYSSPTDVFRCISLHGYEPKGIKGPWKHCSKVCLWRIIRNKQEVSSDSEPAQPGALVIWPVSHTTPRTSPKRWRRFLINNDEREDLTVVPWAA